jgi:putative two-component system response regulator
VKRLRVLLVEDSVDDAELVIAELQAAGFDPVYTRVDTAAGLREALSDQWDVVLSDHSAPSFDSQAALRIVAETGRDIPFIIVSGTIGEEAAVRAMKAGANDYIVKDRLGRLVPALNRELTEAEHRRARREAEAALLEHERRAAAELAAAYDQTLEGWARALELRDQETEGHSRRVTEMTLRLAQNLGVTGDDLVHIRRGCLLHDIGKMGIPDRILLKPARLSDEEWEIMRRHPVYAYELLNPIAYLRPALDIPYAHHEKWDGSGYPRGLSGEAIPFAARMFAVADIWDALCSDRPYRQAWPREKVLAHIQALAGTELDPQIVAAFVRMVETS